MTVAARCLMCGKLYDVTADNTDYKKLVDKSSEKKEVTFICDMCKNRVRDESDKKQKPHKPM